MFIAHGQGFLKKKLKRTFFFDFKKMFGMIEKERERKRKTLIVLGPEL
jgi:hypothetical protein